MKRFIVIAFMATVAIAMFSCEKQETPSRYSGSKQQTIASSGNSYTARGGGEDDDGPIIMVHIVLDEDHELLPDATVTMTTATDTLNLATDSDGECTFNLPGYGNWHLEINRQGYEPLDTVINVVDSFSVKTSVLQP